jgi:NadR type nicotinamide-nucleotide adenylyltransferase
MHLIETARSQVDHLTVLVCSIQREPIPGALRFEWVRTLYADVNVQHCTDENPQYPEEHPDFWDIWVATIRKFVPAGPDLVFTSELYGDELARRLGARHVLVDLARSQFPVSGTAVRERPFEYWDLIPESVRAYYARKVALVGAESTGKTKLAAQLASYFGTIRSEEYGRLFVEQVRPVAGEDDMRRIALGQAALEDQAIRQANRLLVCDTDLLATLIWHERYCGAAPPELQALYAARRSHLYLLCEADLPWRQDGSRDSGGEWRPWFRRRFVEELEARQLPYVSISGGYQERFDRAVAAIERYFPDAAHALGLPAQGEGASAAY